MSSNLTELYNSLRRSWQQFKEHLSEEVPEDIAVCEFDCRKSQCLYGEWESCERRLSKGAGELMPASPTSLVSRSTEGRREHC
jgi:curli biogenesis system outer membrane secretion channel CsgG